ncbi:MAG: transcription-repair coupling factor [Lachnospiraceae bacterium]|nr:transcription-repair coupling factor [Lachnospiraceae bacterium]
MKLKGITEVTGLTDTARTVLSYALAENDIRLFVVADELRAKEVAETANLFGKNVYYYPARDLMFYQADLSGNLLLRQRMQTLKALYEWTTGSTGTPKRPAGDASEKTAEGTSERPAGDASEKTAEGTSENASIDTGSASDVGGLTIITTFDALMEKMPPGDLITDNLITIKPGDEIDTEDLTRALTDNGYEREPEVLEPGQFAVRGGIIDIYPLTDDNPYRIEFWGDEVDSIREFDALSQRSIEQLKKIDIYPATDLITNEDIRVGAKVRIEEEGNKTEERLRKSMNTEAAYRIKTATNEICEGLIYNMAGNLSPYITYLYDKTDTFLDKFKNNKIRIFIDEPARCEERGLAVEKEWSDSSVHRIEGGYMLPGEADIMVSAKSVYSSLMSMPVISMSMIELHHELYKAERRFSVNSRGISSYHKVFTELITDLKQYKKNGSRVVILSPSHTRARKLTEDIRELEINAFYSDEPSRDLKKGEIMLSYGNLSQGFEFPDIGFAVISESDIFGGRVRKKRRRHSQYEGTRIASYTDLTVGDYVVHEDHGIGVYRGIIQIEIGGVTRDYVRIEYSGGNFVNVFASNLGSLQKYAGKDSDKKIKLSKIGGTEWTRNKAKVKKSVDKIARQLVELYAERSRDEGYTYGEDTVWQKEFEEVFPFEETEDQLKAIEEVKADMQSNKIMDRLICGDVGFGKTEVAIRAAFKAVQEGKQVAVLVPTTILAEQHMQTFTQRMSSYPVKIEMLSRFRTPSQMKKTIAGLKSGGVDIVIGTHRLLSKDVGFKNLGLLVVDEEQRFGVTHKERIKELRHNVDVMTLTATPIPRTLHMSLVGIRDMSILTEAPQDRQPIQTFVMEYSEEMVREAITRELARNGQVYYVYNRVSDIADIAAKIQALLPDAVVAYAHGQMNERQLEDIMVDFINGEIDILVSTTIIETGLDIPNVNTIIVHDSERMGLAQLYQLRGRVGRSNRTAYAFLMYRKNKMLKETAEKRLAAIKEFTDLGSGFRIAMKDLEIRGAGNVLGAEQSGHMAEVGYDLYCKMLDTAVKKEKGIDDGGDYSTYINMDIDAMIPDNYVRNESMKLDLYKRIAQIASEEEASDIRDELLDRFGKVPRGTENLIDISLLRMKAHRLFIESMTVTDKEITMAIYMNATIDPTNIAPMLNSFNGKMRFVTNKKPTFIYSIDAADKKLPPLDITSKVLDGMEMMVK